MIRVQVNITDTEGVVLEQFDVIYQNKGSSDSMVAMLVKTKLEMARDLLVVDPGEVLGDPEDVNI